MGFTCIQLGASLLSNGPPRAGVISLAAIGVEVGDEAVAEASAAAQRATAMLDALFPAVLSAFRCEGSLGAAAAHKRYARYAVRACCCACSTCCVWGSG